MCIRDRYGIQSVPTLMLFRRVLFRSSGRVKDEHTMHAYLLMMMQPFMTMDDLSVSVLSDKDKADLYKICLLYTSCYIHI